MRIIHVVNYTGEIPALSLLLIFQLGYFGALQKKSGIHRIPTQIIWHSQDSDTGSKELI